MITAIKNPHLLPLLFFALLPLLLHMLDRRRARVVVWPAMRFLVPRDVRQARRIRRREALLLLTRTALALLAAATFLGPVSTTTKRMAAPASIPRDLVIVVDVSYSMTYRDAKEAPSALERAREAALNELDRCAPGSRAVVISAPGNANHRRETAVAAAASFDPLEVAIDNARRGARDAVVQGGSFLLADALDRAAEHFVTSGSQPAEILILTDLQKSSFAGLDPGRLRFLRERLAKRPQLRIRIVDCGAENPVNRFVAELDVEPLAALVDQSIDLRFRIESAGAPMAEAPLAVHVVDEGGGSELLSLAPGADGAITTTLARKLTVAGDARLLLRLPDDGLVDDNSRRVVIQTRDRLEVLILGDPPESDRAGTSKYVDLALAPRARAASAPPLAYRPRVVQQLLPSDLEACAVLIVTALDRLDDEQARALESFVRRGGGLFILASARVNAPALTERLHRNGNGILPSALLARKPGVSTTMAYPQILVPEHAALRVFRGPEAGDLGRVRVGSWTPCGDRARDTAILASLNDGSPWLLERRVGAGRVIVLATSGDTEDSDLPLTPLFLPLVHRLTRYLAATAPTERALEIGQAIRWPLPAPLAAGEVTVTDPRGASRAAELHDLGGRKIAGFDDTALPGFYELAAPTAAGLATATFAVNVSGEESRLDRIEPAALEELRRSLGAEIVRDLAVGVDTSVTVPVERELWPFLLALTLAAFFAELWVLRGFPGSQSLAARPSPEAK